MAVEIATAYVTILPSARGFGRSLSRELDGQGMNTAGANAGRQASAGFAKALTVGVALAATAAAAGIATLGKSAATYGLKIASQNEQASISFETLLGSAEAAATMINDLKRFAAETPFEFPELQKAAGSLLTTGVAASKIIPIMRTLGDVTSGMGTGSEGVQRATIALQQMNAAGRITAEDLNQLRDAGIPVFDLLAGATGRSKEELSAMAQNGKLAKKELTQLMDALETGRGLEKFTGLMEKQSKSLLGLWSTLKDNLGQGLAEAMAPAIVSIKAQLPGISVAIADGLKVLGPTLTGVTTLLIDTLGKLVPLVTPVLDTFGQLFAETLRGLADIVLKLLPPFSFLARVLGDRLGGALAELLPEVGDLLVALSPLAILVTRLAITAMSALAPALSALLRAVTPLAAALATGLWKAFERFAGLDLNMFDELTVTFVAVADALMPLVDVFLQFADDAAAALVAILPDVITGFADLSHAFLPMLPDITRLARDLLPVMVDMFTELAPDAIDLARQVIPLADAMFRLRLIWGDMLFRVIAPFLPVILHLAEVVLPLLEKVLVPIVEAVVDFAGALSESNVGMAVLIALIGTAFMLKLAVHFVLATIQGYNLLTVLTLVNAAMAAQRGITEANNLAMEEGVALTFFQKLTAGISGAAASSWVLNAALAVGTALLSPWFLIPAAIAAVGAAFYFAYKDIQPFREAVDALWASFQVGLDWLKELIGIIAGGDFGKADEMVATMANNILASLSNLGGTIRQKAGEWATAALEGLKDLAGRVGTFLIETGVPALVAAAKAWLNAFIWWITDVLPHIALGLARVWLYLARFLYTQLIPWLVKTGGNLLSAFIGWISEAVPAALEALGGFFQAIIPWITDTALPWLTAAAANLATALWGWVKEAVPPLLAQLGELLVAIGGWIAGTAVPWLVGAGVKLGGALLSWLVDVVPKVVVGLASLIIAIETWYWGTAIPWLVNAGWDLLQAFIGWIKGAVPAALEALGGFFQSIIPWITTTAFPRLTEAVSKLATALWAWVSEAVPPLLARLGEFLGAIGSWIIGTAVPWLVDAGTSLGGALISWLADVVPKLLLGLGGLIFAFGKWYYGTAVPWLYSAGLDLLRAILGFFGEGPGRIAAGFAFLLDNIGGWIITAAVWIGEKAAGLAVALWGWVSGAVPPLLAKLGEWLGALGSWIVGTGLPWLGEKVGELAGALWGWVAEAVPQALAALGGWLQSIGVWIAETAVPWLISKGLSLMLAMLLWAVKLTVEMPVYLAKLLLVIGGFIVKAVPWLIEKGQALSKAFIGWLVQLPILIPKLLFMVLWKIGEWIVAAVPWLAERALALYGALRGWIDQAVAAVPGLLVTFGQNIANWINSAVPWLIGEAGNLLGAIMGWIGDAIAAAPGRLVEWGDAILGFIRGLPKQIGDAAAGMFLGLSNAFITAINWIIRVWNDLRLEVAEVEILGKKFGPFVLESNNLPELANIGSFAQGGRPPVNKPSLVGELGPELFWPDRAGTVVPNNALNAPSGGLNVGKIEVSGQDRPAETAFAIRTELAWQSMLAGAT